MTIKHPMYLAYKSAKIPMWVSTEEIRSALARRHYSLDIAIELSDWIARRNCMCFAAGYLAHKIPVINHSDVVRQLLKMKYSEQRAVELASMIVDNAASSYRKGCERRNLIVH